MKNIYKLLLIALPLAGCAQFEEENPDPSRKDGVLVSINARVEGGTDTKTHMGTLSGTTYPVLWSAGDKIGLLSGIKTELALTGGADTKTGEFQGYAEDIVRTFPSTNLYPAAYPAEDAFAEVTDDEILVGSYLPYLQVFKESTFDDNVYPMASVSTDGINYQFYNLAGVIQLKIKANSDYAEHPEFNRIRAIYLTGNNDEVIAGGIGMKYSVSDGSPIASSLEKDYNYEIATYGSEGYQRVIIDFSGQPGGYLQLTPEDTYINVAVLPQTFTNGFKVEMVDWGKGGSYFKESVDAITVKRSHVLSMSSIIYQQPDPINIANSYIFSDDGYYIMPAYAMGNRLDLGVIQTPGTTLAVDLLWTDMVDEAGNDLGAVTNVEYVPSEDGKGSAQFKVNIDPNTGEPYRGNAAIALYEVETNKILWTWHLWLCEQVHDVVVNGYCDGGEYICQYPDGSVYHYQAESSAQDNKKDVMIIMDRNLGAISANREDGWKTYGLYYQNGRRDPFIGGHDNGTADRSNLSSISGGDESYIKDNVHYMESSPFNTDEYTAKYWYNPTLAPNHWRYVPHYITISQAFASPMDYSCNVENGGWAQWSWYEDEDNISWQDESKGGSHGATGLSGTGHEAYWNRTKTILDPCPVGYSVLGAGNDKSYFGMSDMSPVFYASDADGYGVQTSWTYDGQTYSTWWPAAGVRTFYGRMAEVGYYGIYFYYDHQAASHGGHGMAFYMNPKTDKGVTTYGQILTTINTLTNHAGSVRCVREKQFGDLEKYPINIKPSSSNP